MRDFKMDASRGRVNISLGLDPSKLGEMADLAISGDADAKSVLRHEISEHEMKGKPLPPELEKYASGQVKRRRGPAANAELERDWLIAQAIAAVVRLGFQRKRGRATKSKPSACSIVTEVLAEFGVHMAVGTVDDISDKWIKFVRSY
jgi:hypothetical protein